MKIFIENLGIWVVLGEVKFILFVDRREERYMGVGRNVV